MEDPKDDKKEKHSPELKEELTEEEAKSVDGGGIINGNLNEHSQTNHFNEFGPLRER